MLLSVVMFTSNSLIIRWAGLFADVNGWLASFTRGVAGTIFVLALYSRGRGLELKRVTQPLIILRGILGVTGITILYFTIIHLGAGRALLLNLSYPIFGVIFASLLLGERLTLRISGYLTIATIGLAIFFWPSLKNATFSSYDLLGILGAIVAGTTVVLIRQLTKTETAPTIYTGQCFITLLITAPFAAPSFTNYSLAVWGLLLLGGFIVAYGQILLTKGFFHLDVARGSALQMLIPPLTGLGSLLFFEERFQALELFGGTLIIFATWRITQPNSSKREANSKQKGP